MARFLKKTRAFPFHYLRWVFAWGSQGTTDAVFLAGLIDPNQTKQSWTSAVDVPADRSTANRREMLKTPETLVKPKLGKPGVSNQLVLTAP